MRILNVTQSYAPFFEFGGPPEKVRALAEGLAKKGHAVGVLTADWGLERRLLELGSEVTARHSPFGRRCEQNGVTAIYLRTWLHYRATSWNPAMARYLRTCLPNFDVVHIFGLYDLLGPQVASACRERKIPYIVEPIGMYVPIVRNLWLKRMYHRLWGTKMLAGASAVLATADQEQAELVSGGIAKEKIILRRNGVEVPAVFQPPGRFREALRIPGKAKLILYLGRLSQKKSPDLLLEAFASLAAHKTGGDAPVHLAFVGPDESGMLARLRRMAAEKSVGERVHFSGPLRGESKWAAYRDADIFALPSQNENFGNTAGEAVAAGTPVIVTEHCGIAPLLDGVAGLVVKHERNALMRALEELLGNEVLRTKLKDGCATAIKRLGWARPIQEMEFLLQRLAGPGKS
jgi:glycosyltransferase involved in cell wall biosynthesis